MPRSSVPNAEPHLSEECERATEAQLLFNLAMGGDEASLCGLPTPNIHKAGHTAASCDP